MKFSINWLLVFIPVSLVLEHLGSVSPPLIFFSAALAIVPIAALIVRSTGQLATYTGDAVGGLLNATFGNAPELIIALVALHAGQLAMVRASIIGAILANLLLAPDETVRQEAMLNVGVAAALLAIYVLYLVYSLQTHRTSFASEGGEGGHGGHGDEGARWSLPRALLSLVVASLLAAWMSEVLVGAADG